MTTTPLETVNGLKTAHASAILAKIAEVVALIGAEPDLWFGGLPPVFEDLLRVADHRSAAIRETFSIET